MAWIDDRAWCHPKLADLTDKAFRLWVNGISYSSGFGTRGILTPGHQRTIGATPRLRAELVAAGIWEQRDDNVVYIHDWHDHNGKRDDRRAADRERKRAARAAGRSAGTSAGQSAGRSTVSARVEGSEGSEGTSSRAVTGSQDDARAKDEQPDIHEVTPNLREIA